MAKKAAATHDDAAPKGRIGTMFSTTRQKMIFSYMFFYFAVDVAFLGLVSEQLHKFGNTWTNYPDGRWYHALGLGLFAALFGLLFSLFHWAASHTIYLFCFFAAGVFFGTVAGIFYPTPYGHGLMCGLPVDQIFPEKYRSMYSQCSRITAIEALAWTLFGLSVIGFFWTISDKWSFVSKRANVYTPYVAPEKPKHTDEESADGH